MKNNASTTIKMIIAVAYAAVIAFGVFQIRSAESIMGKTGIVVVKASSSSAQLSVTQNNRQVAIIGTGTARIRIAPGTYLFGAVNNGQQTGTIASVSLKKMASANLNLANSVVLRYAGDINFQNTNELTNSGISSNQLEEFEEYIFEYNHAANSVVISPSSVEPGPHNPNLVQPFTLNFQLTIDHVVYEATLSYTDVTDTSLNLYENGNLVFSQSPSSAISGD